MKYLFISFCMMLPFSVFGQGLEQWRAAILSFECGKVYDNPFLDVVISATFSGPNGTTIWREAYWDGGNSYKIQFAPTLEGRWEYTLKAPEETGLNGVSGVIDCIKYTGELDIYKHGFLKIGGQGTYIAYNDDTPFFWLGDTHWDFVVGERWGESNHPNMACMFRGMVDKRVEQGFNVYQTSFRSQDRKGSPRSWLDGHFWADGKEGELPDVSFYQNEVDKRMYYIADKGLVNAIGFGWGHSILGKLNLQKNLARYIVARYGALPVVWTLAGEVADTNSPKYRERLDGWREVALLVEKLDGYNTLQTAHYTNERPFPGYYQDESWYDFTLNQAGHGDLPITAKEYREHRAKYPKKPFIEGEALYELCSTLEINGRRMCTADMMRRTAYLSIQAGGCGYTYGAQGIWDTVWESPEKPDPKNTFNAYGVSWIDGIDAVGGDQMTYLKKFYEDVDFSKLLPVRDCFISAYPFDDEIRRDMYNPLITANSDMSAIVMYYPTIRRAGDGSKITGLRDTPYCARWFNPRTGEYTLISDRLSATGGEWEIPGLPSYGDWLLLLQAKPKTSTK